MTTLIPVERHEKIVTLLNQNGVVRVNELSNLLHVSQLTVRRDLALLEENGVLERTHGGAVLRRKMIVEPAYGQKSESEIEEKRAIAMAVAAQIKDHETLFINSGSTTREVIRALNHRPVRIITNNIDGATLLLEESVDLIVLGGIYRSRSMSTVGEAGINQLKKIRADHAIIGADGFSLKYGITSPVESQAEITRHMLAQTMGEVIVVADHTKIEVVSTFKIAELNEISQLITDKAAEERIDGDKLKKTGIHLQLV